MFKHFRDNCSQRNRLVITGIAYVPILIFAIRSINSVRLFVWSFAVH